jgi:hypothetical protein
VHVYSMSVYIQSIIPLNDNFRAPRRTHISFWLLWEEEGVFASCAMCMQLYVIFFFAIRFLLFFTTFIRHSFFLRIEGKKLIFMCKFNAITEVWNDNGQRSVYLAIHQKWFLSRLMTIFAQNWTMLLNKDFQNLSAQPQRVLLRLSLISYRCDTKKMCNTNISHLFRFYLRNHRESKKKVIPVSTL